MKKIALILAVVLVMLSVVPAMEVLAAGLQSRSSGHTIRFMDTDVYLTVPAGFRLSETYENSVCYVEDVLETRLDNQLWFRKTSYMSIADRKTSCESNYTNVSVQTINGIETVSALRSAKAWICYFNRGNSSYYFEFMGENLSSAFESTMNSLQIIGGSQATPAPTATPTPPPVEGDGITLWFLHSGATIKLPNGYKCTSQSADSEKWENQTSSSLVFVTLAKEDEYKDIADWKRSLNSSFFYKESSLLNINGIEVAEARTKTSDNDAGTVLCYFNSGYSSYRISFNYAGSWDECRAQYREIRNSLKMMVQPTATPEITPTPIPVCQHANTVIDAAIAATCTSTGLTEGSHCTDCGNVLVAQEIIPALSQDGTHSFTGRIEDVTDPTCTKSGLRRLYCIRCEAFEEVTVPALDHDYSGKVETVREPSCTDDGLRRISCVRCTAYTDEVVSALGHDWQEAITDPTCTESGLHRTYCTRCDAGEEEVIPALGHTEMSIPAVDSTCETNGRAKAVYCSVCFEVLEGGQSLPMKEHRYNSGYYTTRPTCEKGGVIKYTCLDCGASRTEDVEPTGHTEGDWYVVKEPTLYVSGLKENRCKSCRTVLSTEEIPPLGTLSITTDKAVYNAGEKVYATITVSGPAERYPAVVTYYYEVMDENQSGAYVPVYRKQWIVYEPDKEIEVIAAHSGAGYVNLIVTASFKHDQEIEQEYLVPVGLANPVATPTPTATPKPPASTVTPRPTATSVPTAAPRPTASSAPMVTPVNGVVRVVPGDSFKTDVVITEISFYPPYDTSGTIRYDATNAPVKLISATENNQTANDRIDVRGWSEIGYILVYADTSETPYVMRTGKVATLSFQVDDDAKPGTYTITVKGEGDIWGVDGGVTLIVEHANIVTDEAVPPTCTSVGLTEGSHCTYCGEVFVAQEEIPALAHTEGEPVEITAPTETTPGAAMVCCETCHGIIRMEEIPALGPARVPGDCDDDGSVDSVDLLLLLQYLSGWDVEINLLNADVNGDGNVDISDPVLILQ